MPIATDFATSFAEVATLCCSKTMLGWCVVHGPFHVDILFGEHRIIN